MFNKILKLPTVIKRDGLWYTIKRSTAWTIAHTPLSRFLSFSYYKNTRLVFAPAMLLYRLFANPRTRRKDVSVLEKHYGEGSVVLDIGANVGSFTIAAGAIVGPAGTVLAFEPSPKFADIVSRNIKRNKFQDFVKIHQVALGNKEGVVHLNEDVADDTTNYVTNKGTAVPQATLDSYTEKYPRIHFIKMDAEGSEYDILKGGHETMQKTEVILIEFCNKTLRRAGISIPDFYELLASYFTLYEKSNEEPFVFDPAIEYNMDLIGYSKTI